MPSTTAWDFPRLCLINLAPEGHGVVLYRDGFRVVIQCPNPTCRAYNGVDQNACQVCQSLLIRRYLWAVGEGLNSVGPDTLIADRFQVVQGNLLLDTRPGELHPALDGLPPMVVPYLRLSHLASQIPRPFAYLAAKNTGLSTPLLLLEKAPIQETGTAVKLLPTLESQWPQASPLRQVNWLRQLAHLWSPLLGEGVVGSLLRPDLLRVDGSLIRLLALTPPGPQTEQPLSQLGKGWQSLAKKSHASLRPFLLNLIEQLIAGEIKAANQLVSQLEQATTRLATAQPVMVELATATDQGPTRQRNEDACYPADGSDILIKITATDQQPQTYPLLVVCDGIGGHEGGDVASQLAIAEIESHLSPILRQTQLTSQVVHFYLQRAIRAANDAISARNDSEQRQARGRMGTTLVMALVHPPFLYLAHLGDSRAYRITTNGCDQVTLDDDVASRESRLGYALYRDALHIPNAGSLIQALGISNSDYLVPIIQHHLIDDDCLYLLCSDGLSDFDRVEGVWRMVVRPVLQQQTSVAAVTQQLITIANTYNGHDNVTVGLLRLRSLTARSFPILAAELFPATPDQELVAELEAPPTAPVTQPGGATKLANAATAAAASPGSAQTVQVAPSRRRARWPGLGLLAIAVALVSGGLSWWYLRSQPSPQPLQPLGIAPTLVPSLPSLTVPTTTSAAVTIGSYWQVKGATSAPQLLPEPTATTATAGAAATTAALPAGSILKVTRRQVIADQTEWVQLQICSTPAGTAVIPPPQESDTPSPEVAPDAAPEPAASDRWNQLSLPGESGWMRLNLLLVESTPLSPPTPTQQGLCR